MAEAAARRAGKDAADDGAVVDHGVADHEVLCPGKAGNDTDVGAIATDENDGIVDAIVFGQSALQLAMRDTLACHDAAGGAGYAVTVHRGFGGLDDLEVA